MLHSDVATAVGHIPSGLFIVSVMDPETKKIDGYLASWVQQVSFNPLLISLAIKPGRPAYDLIKSGKVFSVNVVGEHDKTYLRHFWKGYDPNSNPFNELNHTIAPNGGVVLLQAKSTMECKLVDSLKPGDHEVVIAKVISSAVMEEGTRPMVHVRKTGTDY
jgi:flavin reductase (DIM6/NTAB) family NADH-FMN oxidoreductase RutF